MNLTNLSINLIEKNTAGLLIDLKDLQHEIDNKIIYEEPNVYKLVMYRNFIKTFMEENIQKIQNYLELLNTLLRDSEKIMDIQLLDIFHLNFLTLFKWLVTPLKSPYVKVMLNSHHHGIIRLNDPQYICNYFLCPLTTACDHFSLKNSLGNNFLLLIRCLEQVKKIIQEYNSVTVSFSDNSILIITHHC